MTWRQLRRELQNMDEGRLNGQALLYIPPAFNKEKGEVLELERFTLIGDKMAEEHDLVEDDFILVRR